MTGPGIVHDLRQFGIVPTARVLTVITRRRCTLRHRALPAGRVGSFPLNPIAVSTAQRRLAGTGDEAVPDHAMGLHHVTDYSVGPYGEALPRGKKAPGFAVGKRGAYHGMYCGPLGQHLLR